MADSQPEQKWMGAEVGLKLNCHFALNDRPYYDMNTALNDDRQGMLVPVAEARFTVDEREFRSRLTLSLTAIRKIDYVDKRDNPSGIEKHCLKIEFNAKDIVMNDKDKKILGAGSKLPQEFGAPDYRCSSESPLVYMPFEVSQWVVIRPDVPVLYTRALESTFKDIVTDLRDLKNRQQALRVHLLLDDVTLTVSFCLRKLSHAIKHDKEQDPMARWIKNAPNSQQLQMGNLHGMDTRPQPEVSRSQQEVFHDALEYRVSHVYNAIRKQEWDNGLAAEFLRDEFAIKMIEVLGATGKASEADNNLSKVIRGYINFTSHNQPRPDAGASFQVRIPETVPGCPPYTGATSMKQYKAQQKAALKKHLADEKAKAWEAAAEGAEILPAGNPDGDDDSEDEGEDQENAKEKLHFWQAYIVKSDVNTPKGWVEALFIRPRDSRWQGPKSQRPHVGTIINVLPAKYNDDEAFANAVSSHPAIQGCKLVPYSSNQVLKDQVRCLDSLFSPANHSPLQNYLAKFLISADPDIEYPTLDLLPVFRNIDWQRAFDLNYQVPTAEQQVLVTMLHAVKGLLLVKGSYGSAKTRTGLRIVSRYLNHALVDENTSATPDGNGEEHSRKVDNFVEQLLRRPNSAKDVIPAEKLEEVATALETAASQKVDNFVEQLLRRPNSAEQVTPVENLEQNTTAPESASINVELGGEKQPARVLWTTESNLNVDSSAQRLFNLCEKAGTTVRIIRAYALQGEKDHVKHKYIKEPQFDPLPVSDHLEAEFLLEARIRDKSRATLKLHKSGDKRRRLTNLSLAAAMVIELEENEDNDSKYRALQILMGRVNKNPEDVNISHAEIKSLLGHLQDKTLRKANVVFATNAGAIRHELAASFHPALIIQDECARGSELSNVAVWGAYHTAKAVIQLYDSNQMEPTQLHAPQPNFNDPFWKQGSLSCPERLERAGVKPAVLFTQYRCYGSIPEFVNKRFYHDMVTNANHGSEPPALKFVREFMADRYQVTDNIAVIECPNSRSHKEENGTSSVNSHHVHVIMNEVEALLAALDEIELSWAKKFTIKIVTNYKASCQEYADRIRDLTDVYKRVTVVVGDSIQGESAGFEYRDWVSSSRITSFNGDGKRMTVTGTRAIWGLVDIINPSVFEESNYDKVPKRGIGFHSAVKHVYAYWRYAQDKGITFTIQAPDNRKCFACDEVGHSKEQCPNPLAKVKCNNCDELGHKRTDCPEPKKFDGVCYNCGEYGHHKSTCQNPKRSKCKECSGYGHIKEDCPTIRCENCEQFGHMRHKCPEPKRKQCSICRKVGHGQKDCKGENAPTRFDLGTQAGFVAFRTANGNSQEQEDVNANARQNTVQAMLRYHRHYNPDEYSDDEQDQVPTVEAIENGEAVTLAVRPVISGRALTKPGGQSPNTLVTDGTQTSVQQDNNPGDVGAAWEQVTESSTTNGGFGDAWDQGAESTKENEPVVPFPQNSLNLEGGW